MRVALKFLEALNRHDVAGMMQLVSDDSVYEDASPAPDGALYSGKQEITRFWEDYFLRSSHAHVKAEEIFGFGERCVMRWTTSWVDVEGHLEQMRGVDLFRVRDGSIIERLSYIKG